MLEIQEERRRKVKQQLDLQRLEKLEALKINPVTGLREQSVDTAALQSSSEEPSF